MSALIKAALFLLFFLNTPALSENIPSPVKVKLVSEIEETAPGQVFRLGVLFDIDPGWHIYWKNPGQTGLPTKINFITPRGYEISPPYWPIPSYFKKPGGGYDYGYENNVLLWRDVRVPVDARSGQVNLEVKTSWLSCKEICIPGKETLAYELAIGNSVKTGNDEIFNEWQSLIPQTYNDNVTPFNFQIEKTSSGGEGFIVRLIVKPTQPIHNIEYYPDPGENFYVRNLKKDQSEDLKNTVISFDVSQKGSHELSGQTLDGLIVYENEHNKRFAVEISVNFTDN